MAQLVQSLDLNESQNTIFHENAPGITLETNQSLLSAADHRKESEPGHSLHAAPDKGEASLIEEEKEPEKPAASMEGVLD